MARETPSPSRRHAGTVWPAMLTSAALVAQLVAGKATRDALFLTHFNLKLLPAAMVGGAVLSALSVIVMSRALARLGPARVVPGAFAVSAVLFLCEWSLSLKSEHATAIAVYAHTAIFGTAIGSAFWSLVNERYNPHEAKLLVGRIASGGTVGGVVGGLLVWRASAHLSVPMMLAILATMSVVGLWGSLRTAPADAGPVSKKKDAGIVTAGGTDVIGATPYLRDLALLVACGAVVQALLDWLLSQQATERWHGASLLGFFALFNMIVGVFTFITQTLVTRPVLERRGLAGTIKLQPISVIAAGIAAIVAPAVFVFHAVTVLRVIEGVTRGSLYRSAYELFYTPLPAVKKRASKTLIDVGVDRVGTAVGSGALFLVAHLATRERQTQIVLGCVIGISVIAWYISRRLQDGYVAALASSLKSGALELGEDDTEDLITKKTLAETTTLLDRDKLLARIEHFQRQKDNKKQLTVSTTLGDALPSSPSLTSLVDPTDPIVVRAAGLRSKDAAAVKRALATPLTVELAPFAIPLLANDAVVRDAVRGLRKIAPRIVGSLVDHLLDVTDVDPRVRRRIPRILKTCKGRRTLEGLLLALEDPVFEVRIQVGIALTQLVEEGEVLSDREAIFRIVQDELTTRRPSWALQLPSPAQDSDREPEPASQHDAEDATGGNEELRRGLAHTFAVLGLVLEREPLQIAYRASRGEDPALRGTAFEYLEVVLPAQIRALLVPLLGDVKAAPTAPRSRERHHTELAAELLRSQAGARSVRSGAK